MSESPGRKIFVNLAVRDLPRAVDFFTRLGFRFEPDFTDDHATCMILSEEGYVMLLDEPRFGDFTTRKLCDTATHTEALLALSCSSRQEVDDMMATAVASGGREAMPVQDHGFMYGRSFYDPDGHHWELIWMDPAAQGGQ